MKCCATVSDCPPGWQGERSNVLYLVPAGVFVDASDERRILCVAEEVDNTGAVRMHTVLASGTARVPDCHSSIGRPCIILMSRQPSGDDEKRQQSPLPMLECGGWWRHLLAGWKTCDVTSPHGVACSPLELV